MGLGKRAGLNEQSLGIKPRGASSHGLLQAVRPAAELFPLNVVEWTAADWEGGRQKRLGRPHTMLQYCGVNDHSGVGPHVVATASEGAGSKHKAVVADNAVAAAGLLNAGTREHHLELREAGLSPWAAAGAAVPPR